MPHDTRLPLLGQSQASSHLSAATLFATLFAALPPHAPPARSLYIHVPFCFHKCHYCDFYSFVDTQDRQAPFTDRLIRELAAQAHATQGLPLTSIFVGGGTPSLLRTDLWQRLLAALHHHYTLDPHCEFTVECNPETVTPDLMAILHAGRVNRVSIGAQSFNPTHLKTLERWHNPDNVAKALDLARAAHIPRQSIDLIFGIPGQSLADLESDLRHALALGTTHLSVYNLTYEPNTAMTARLKRGDFTPAHEDLEIDMYDLTATLLAEQGLDRYEVSNYAKPGHESQHNLAYWRQHSWLAAGPSASGHLLTSQGSYRWKNVPRLDDYLTHDHQGFAPIRDLEPPDPARLLRERVMTGLRLREGLDAHSILTEAATIDPSIPTSIERAIQRQITLGALTTTNNRWHVTPKGWLIADAVAADIMASLTPREPQPRALTPTPTRLG